MSELYLLDTWPGPVPFLTPTLTSLAILLLVLVQQKPWTRAFGAMEKVKGHHTIRASHGHSLGVWGRARMARTGEKVTNVPCELEYVSFPLRASVFSPVK